MDVGDIQSDSAVLLTSGSLRTRGLGRDTRGYDRVHAEEKPIHKARATLVLLSVNFSFHGVEPNLEVPQEDAHTEGAP